MTLALEHNMAANIYNENSILENSRMFWNLVLFPYFNQYFLQDRQVMCQICQWTKGLSTELQFRLDDGPSIVQRPRGQTDCHLSSRSIDNWTVNKSAITRV